MAGCGNCVVFAVMSVKHCTLPWTWLVFDANGNAMPCCQARAGVGNLRDRSMEDLWNGYEMRSVRRLARNGEIPSTCRGSVCAFVQAQLGRGPAIDTERPQVDEHLAEHFDEDWYLARYPDVANAVRRHQVENGLDHFVHFGRAEGREHRVAEPHALSPHAQALVDYTEGRTFVSAGPRDLVIGVTNV
jgi:hypothetical protein